MNMNTVTFPFSALALACLAGCGSLEPERLATIERVQPHEVRVTETQQVCRDVVEQQRAQERDGLVGGTVAGAVIGGLVGNQVGGGKGKKLATVAGAVAGGAIGREVDKRHEGGKLATTTRQDCSMQPVTRTVQDGFEVTYTYAGRQYTAVLPLAPQGDTVRVNADGSLAAAQPLPEPSDDAPTTAPDASERG
jgi:uncharacterized protein YcfJ